MNAPISKIAIAATLFLSCLPSDLLDASPQESVKSSTQILDKLKTELKLASQGKPQDFESLEERVKQAVQKQTASFVNRLKRGDAKSKSVAESLELSMTFSEDILSVLQYELLNEPMPDMEAVSFRESLDEIGMRIANDLSFVEGAIPDEKKVVRICLPDLHVCGGCKVKLETALNETQDFTEATVNLDTLTAQFLAPVEFDIATKLVDMEKSVVQLKNWKLVRE